MNYDAVADAAMKSLGRHGLPVVKSDMAGLYVGPGLPKLTLGQLINLACRLDPSFDPARAALGPQVES